MNKTKMKPILVCKILTLVLFILLSFITILTISIEKKNKACKEYSEEYGDVWSDKVGHYVVNKYWSCGKQYGWSEEDGAYVVLEDWSFIDDRCYGSEPSVDEVIEMRKEEIRRMKQLRNTASYTAVFLILIFAVFSHLAKKNAKKSDFCIFKAIIDA